MSDGGNRDAITVKFGMRHPLKKEFRYGKMVASAGSIMYMNGRAF